MPWVDPSRRAIEATAAEQVARPKMAIAQVDNGDGTFSYYHLVALAAGTEVSVSGGVEVTLGGATPDVDASTDALGVVHTAQVVKLRLGGAGVDDGLVSEANPVPTESKTTNELLVTAIEELRLVQSLLLQLLS